MQSPAFLPVAAGPAGSGLAKLYRAWALLAVLACVLTGAAPAEAAETNAPSGPAAHRFLLIIETSAAMRAQTNNLVRVLSDFAASGMNGQLRPGDTVGIWTYNQELITGEFPLHRWSSRSTNTFPALLARFVGSRKYEKKPKFSSVLPAMTQIMGDSDLITVVLCVSGEGPLSGTAVDVQANQFFTTWKAKQQKARMPFVVVLRGYKRAFTDFSLNTPPWAIELPPLPKEVLAASRASTTPTNRPASTVPPLIVIGKKPATNSPPAVVIPPAVTNSTPVTGVDPRTTSNAATALLTQEEVRSTPPTSSVAVAVNSGGPTSSIPKGRDPVESGVTATQSAAGNSISKETLEKPPAQTTGSAAELSPQLGSVPSATRSSLLFWVATIAAALLVVTAAWVYRRRTRSGGHVSLITQSLDRDKEP